MYLAQTGQLPTEIERIHAPIPDFAPPDPETRDRAVAFLAEHVGAGRPVLVHCGAGYGRTGTILACYLVFSGMDADAAIALVRERRPGSIETPAQEDAVRAYAKEREADATGGSA